MIDRETIEKVFSTYYIVDPPKNVVVLDKPVVAVDHNGQVTTFFKGLQPKWRDDVIIVSPQGDDETLVHEQIHAQYRAREFGANALGKLFVIKYRMLQKLQRQRKIRDVRYKLCNGCAMCDDLTQLLLVTPPSSRSKHYKLVS